MAKKIMVVDDDPNIVEYLVSIFKNQNILISLLRRERLII